MRNVSDESCTENQNKYFVLEKLFSPKIVPFVTDNLEMYCKPGQDTDDNMAHAHCMLDV
jgi:hypothetical protein